MKVRVHWKYQDKSGAFEMDMYEGKEYAGKDDETWDSIDFMFTDGNYSCDCNLSNFAGLREYPDGFPCGDKIHLSKIEQVNGSRHIDYL